MKLPLFRRTTSLDDAVVHAGELSMRVAEASSQCIVSVSGPVTVDSSPQLRSVLLRLLRRGAKPLVIDWSEVTYVDMSGMATLFEALEAARRWSLKLRVVGITGQTRTLAEVAELDTIFLAAGSEVEYR